MTVAHAGATHAPATTSPLSLEQQRLWLLQSARPESSAYDDLVAVRLRGPLDVAALETAIRALVERHEVLRTAFRTIDGEPRQVVVADEAERELDVTDLSAEPDPKASAWSILDEESRFVFRLDERPPVNWRLLRLGPDDHLLALNAHHIVTDGWSLGVLTRELAALYESAAGGAPLDDVLPPLELSFAEHARRQERRLAEGAYDETLASWVERLDGHAVTLELPTDHQRPARSSERGCSVPFALPPGTTDAVRKAARAARTTPFTVLLAALQALFARHAQQERFVLGTGVANRLDADAEGVVGFFANTLAIPADCSGDPSFDELVARVKETMTAAQHAQDLPFQLVAAAVDPTREGSRPPVFNVLVALQNASGSATPLALPGLHAAPIDLPRTSAKFDLAWELFVRDGAIEGLVEVSADLYKRATVTRMVARFERLLADALAHPDRRLSELELLPDDERARILQLGGGPEPVPETALHELVAEQARLHPEAPALRAGSRSLSYGELERAANRLAHRLRELGTEPETLVGVCLPRGIDLVVALLAILKAGGAFLPLDPSYPEERLGFMVDDADAAFCLVDRTTAPLLESAPTRALVLEEEQERLAGYPDEPPPTTTGPRHLAYAIYTSGSTGRPKGVAVEHRSVLRLVLGDSFFSVSPGDRVLHLSSPTFDGSVWEIWTPLARGAELVLFPPMPFAPDLLRDVLREHDVTWAFAPTAAFHAVADYDASILGSLRGIIAGGEALSAVHAERILEACPDLDLRNGYGPTENCAFSTQERVRQPVERPVSIGAPIEGSTAYVLDARSEPAPIGVAGELCLGGAGVARGYVNQPAPTAERFRPDPFGPPGSRMYCSGDLAAWLPDGRIRYLGRRDGQTKVRGYRIELGEVEAAVLELQGVRNAAVAIADADGEKSLVAYVVPEAGARVENTDARRRLGKWLPGHAVPAAFVELSALPLTPNGKVDHAALPAPPKVAAPEEDTAQEPDGMAATVEKIWTAALGVERVDPKESFFGLGGHSLLAIRVTTEVSDALEMPMPARLLFEHPRLVDYVEALERHLGGR